MMDSSDRPAQTRPNSHPMCSNTVDTSNTVRYIGASGFPVHGSQSVINPMTHSGHIIPSHNTPGPVQNHVAASHGARNMPVAAQTLVPNIHPSAYSHPPPEAYSNRHVRTNQTLPPTAINLPPQNHPNATQQPPLRHSTNPSLQMHHSATFSHGRSSAPEQPTGVTSHRHQFGMIQPPAAPSLGIVLHNHPPAISDRRPQAEPRSLSVNPNRPSNVGGNSWAAYAGLHPYIAIQHQGTSVQGPYAGFQSTGAYSFPPPNAVFLGLVPQNRPPASSQDPCVVFLPTGAPPRGLGSAVQTPRVPSHGFPPHNQSATSQDRMMRAQLGIQSQAPPLPVSRQNSLPYTVGRNGVLSYTPVVQSGVPIHRCAPQSHFAAPPHGRPYQPTQPPPTQPTSTQPPSAQPPPTSYRPPHHPGIPSQRPPYPVVQPFNIPPPRPHTIFLPPQGQSYAAGQLPSATQVQGRVSSIRSAPTNQRETTTVQNCIPNNRSSSQQASTTTIQNPFPNNRSASSPRHSISAVTRQQTETATFQQSSSTANPGVISHNHTSNSSHQPSSRATHPGTHNASSFPERPLNTGVNTHVTASTEQVSPSPNLNNLTYGEMWEALAQSHRPSSTPTSRANRSVIRSSHRPSSTPTSRTNCSVTRSLQRPLSEPSSRASSPATFSTDAESLSEFDDPTADRLSTPASRSNSPVIRSSQRLLSEPPSRSNSPFIRALQRLLSEPPSRSNSPVTRSSQRPLSVSPSRSNSPVARSSQRPLSEPSSRASSPPTFSTDEESSSESDDSTADRPSLRNASRIRAPFPIIHPRPSENSPGTSIYPPLMPLELRLTQNGRVPLSSLYIHHQRFLSQLIYEYKLPRRPHRNPDNLERYRNLSVQHSFIVIKDSCCGCNVWTRKLYLEVEVFDENADLDTVGYNFVYLREI